MLPIRHKVFAIIIANFILFWLGYSIYIDPLQQQLAQLNTRTNVSPLAASTSSHWNSEKFVALFTSLAQHYHLTINHIDNKQNVVLIGQYFNLVHLFKQLAIIPDFPSIQMLTISPQKNGLLIKMDCHEA